MAIPKQVEQDLKELEAYESSLADPEAGETSDASPQPENQPIAEPPLAAAPEPKVVELKPDDVWEKKYHTLKGMYDAEVPRLHNQVKDLSTQVAKLLQEVQKSSQPPAPKPEPQAPLVSAKDVEAFGEDLIDVQRRVARETMAPLQAELSKRDERIAQLEAAQSKTVGEVATVTFEQRLNAQVPDFEQVNTDPKWITFLEEIDPYTNEPRRNYAEFIYNSGDVAKLKKVVDYYKATTGKVDSTPDPKEAERKLRQAELERQVTPTRTTSTQPTTPQNTRIFTEKEMESLFSKVRQLNTVGKYDEASKLEAELTEAYMQGRVSA